MVSSMHYLQVISPLSYFAEIEGMLLNIQTVVKDSDGTE